MSDRRGITNPYAVLIILSLINFLNYADRLVLGGVLPKLQESVVDGGLALTDSQCGLLLSAFMIVHSVASIPLGVAADRVLRTRLIAAGVAVWSVATAAAGFANSFWQLFASRASVGIGEAAYAPAATALISEHFGETSRGRAMGVFQAGMVLGGGAGIALGSVVADAWGWRAAFFLVGVPGLVLVAASLAIREQSRRPAEGAERRRPMMLEVRAVLATPGVLWIYGAGILITFMVGAFTNWGVTYVIRYHYGGDTEQLARVGTTFAPVVLLASAAGVFLGSALADRLERRMPGRSRLLVVGLGPLLGTPFVLFGLWAPSVPVMYACLAVGTALNSFYAGPVLAALHDAVGDGVHATATGAYFFLVHLLGDAISPSIVGEISQQTGSLRIALSAAALVAAVGGLAALKGTRSLGGVAREGAQR